MFVLRALAGIVGAVIVCRTLLSAVRTVVVPRAQYSWLTRVHFASLLRVFTALAPPSRPFPARDRLMALYAPLALVALPGVWVALIIVGFGSIAWSVGVAPIGEAFVLSASSITTLGFARPDNRWLTIVAFCEASIGLGLVGLMISYLPSIYGAFSRREALVGMLESRAGLPPVPSVLFARYRTIGRLDNLAEDLFVPWESWFVDIEESHTSQPALLFFRSPHPERSWVTAAGAVLDTAALQTTLVDSPYDARAPMMIRTGFLALRRIADYFDIPYNPDPPSDGPISIARHEFDAEVAALRRAGVPLRDDIDGAWRDFAGWRVNYDEVLVQLAALVMAPPGHWSSDRTPPQTFAPSMLPPSLERLRSRHVKRAADWPDQPDQPTRL